MKKASFIVGLSAVTITAAFLCVSCQKQEPVSSAPASHEVPVLPEQPYAYMQKHNVNDHVATLGRVLFYDRNLSANGAVSCGSCHKQEFAFADNVRFNKGFNGVPLKRNSPSIQGIRGFMNNGFAKNGIPTREAQQPVLLFWDGRQTNAADMVLNPVVNHDEMNMPDFETLINRLQATPYYPEMFRKAFGSDRITAENVAFALEGFMACLNTDNPFSSQPRPHPLFDQRPGQSGKFENLVEAGEFLFHTKYNCARCHDPGHGGGYDNPVSPSQMFNIGLDEIVTDRGVAAITKNPADEGLFKVPTLKNISRTAPYMHDGRFATLGEVLDHYSHGIKSARTLDPLFRAEDGSPLKMNIQPAEKEALIAFLNSLRDDDFLTNPMYSDPFVKN